MATPANVPHSTPCPAPAPRTPLHQHHHHPSQLRAFMQRYYRTALQWLSQGGGPTYPISACFMWNL